jgi:Ca-activated chloride channel family protein
MKQVSKSDERITAFALGEMQGPEKDLFEKELDANVAKQNEVNDIKNFTNVLRLDLAKEALPGRDARLYKNVMNMSGVEGGAIKRVPKKTLIWGSGLLAAAAVAGLAFMPRFLGKEEPAEKTAALSVVNEIKNGASTEQPSGSKPSPEAPAQSIAAEKVRKSIQRDFQGRANHIAKKGQQFDQKDSRLIDPKKLHKNTEAYDLIVENPFKSTALDALSTFSIDVDTASYANVRRFVSEGQMPPKDAVRLEEMVNYFPYSYKAPTGPEPFAVDIEVAEAPWQKDHRLVKIGIKATDIEWGQNPASNLVFLIDISGSMNDSNKLPLLKRALKLLVEKLGANDRVAVVVYAGAAGLALPSTSANQKQSILDVLEKLAAGGSTNGGEGIELAYSVALQHYIKGGINRVIVATDGDFNMGVTSEGQLTRLIEEKAKAGVFLSILGFGMGNYKDATLEKLAGIGNGNYAYIDNENEARKVLVEQIGGTMLTVAKDVKLQVEFNPSKVESYRLLGYENRMLLDQDFDDDAKDAGDIDAGHTVTALYEVVPKRLENKDKAVDPLKYQEPAELTVNSDELMNLKLRYKKPNEEKSNLIELGLKDEGKAFTNASEDFRFAAAVAGVAMVLRDSNYKGSATFSSMQEILSGAKTNDPSGYRQEFSDLLSKLRTLTK